MYLVLTPSKTVGRVPSQQGAPTTCNLTYWEVSKQTDRQTDSLHFSTMISKAMQLMGSYVHTLLVSWDVAIGQNSALPREGGKGGGATSFLTNST